MNSRSPRSRARTEKPRPLRTVTPEHFEEWVGERFAGLGYAVLHTPFRGDHGIDLNVELQGERAIVQCKHWPGRAVGEPVLRDLYGTLQHVAAQAAYLVTSGNATPAARAWAKDKPIQIWDWQYLVEHWPTEIAELAARASTAADASSDIRPGWFVYTDDWGGEWAMRIPRNIGQCPDFGFRPLTNQQALPELQVRYTYVGPVRPRHVRIDPPGPVGRISRSRTVPVGTQAAYFQLIRRPTPTVSLLDGTGQLVEWTVAGGVGESVSVRRATPRPDPPCPQLPEPLLRTRVSILPGRRSWGMNDSNVTPRVDAAEEPHLLARAAPRRRPRLELRQATRAARQPALSRLHITW